jgi:hypothetical protein
MSFAGSVLSMIVSLKNNARPKRKRFKGYNEQRPKTQTHKPRKIPALEMETIKSRISFEADRGNRRFVLYIMIFGICVFIFLALLSRHILP